MSNDCYLLIGNPGTGKSCLLNALIGEYKFKSARSRDGAGITFQLDTLRVPGLGLVMDTPGLADTEMKHEAAKAITNALKKDGEYRIFFVITLEAGRVRPQDTVTMQLVLEAAEDLTEYNIIVNKVSRGSMRDIQVQRQRDEMMARLMQGLPRRTASIHFVQNDPDIDDEDAAMMKEDDQATKDVIDFIKNAIPVKIDSQAVKDVQPDAIAKMEKEHEDALTALKNNQELMMAELQKQIVFLKAEAEKKARKVIWKRVGPGSLQHEGSDKGSGASLDLNYYSYHEPGWLMLGHSNKSSEVVVVQEGPSAKRATKWKRIWWDKGSNNSYDYDIYLPSCDDDSFRALGVVCVFRNKGHTLPHRVPVACVHRDCCQPTDLGSIAWSDRGSGASHDVTLNHVPGIGTMWPSIATLVGSPDAAATLKLKEMPEYSPDVQLGQGPEEPIAMELGETAAQERGENHGEVSSSNFLGRTAGEAMGAVPNLGVKLVESAAQEFGGKFAEAAAPQPQCKRRRES